jgi:hypothetical protein
MVTRVISAGHHIQGATAPPKVRYRHIAAILQTPIGKGLSIVAAGRAFETVEQHKQWPLGWRCIGFTKIDIDKVGIGCAPSLATPLRCRKLKPARPQG